MSRIITFIDRATLQLENTAAEYEKVRSDNNLRLVFHQAGQGVVLVREALEVAKGHLQSKLSGVSENAKKPIKACEQKALLSKRMFGQVAQAPENARFVVYSKLLAQDGKRYMVEVLVQGMMNDVCELVEQCGLGEEMKDEIENLRDAVNDLKEMGTLVDSGERTTTFTNLGEGDQFNSTNGQQNNNTGAGNQLPGASFQERVIFGEQASDTQESKR
ncbi:hypothetical protein QQS21_000233 [Conoideocrella luteorostrata]|uniref:Uncharacterized protein n=1 Tax=Conoideocrella luteorostrata TaxID=1105319 RepID=A0AAJ0D044_9HYPO|nr:hypothetical protein QQS21_000233 [Conoideocrella luteorostrata]